MSGFGERAIAHEINNLADEDMQMNAIRTLKAFGKAAIPQLINVLGDPARNAHAALILIEVGEPAIPALIDALNDDSKKTFASAALNEMGKKKNFQKIVIQRLIDTLKDKRPQTRAIAAVTLQNFGAPALEPYTPSLIDNLGDPDVGPFAGNLLISIGAQAVGPLTDAAVDEGKRELVNTILQEITLKNPTIKMPILSNQKTERVLNQTPTQAMKPRFCKYCGGSLTSNSVYCSQCGKKVE